jgi:hypothetical protein
MKIFKDFKYILIISAIILIMMIIQVCKNNAWTGNAGNAAETMALRTNFAGMEELKKVAGPVTLIMPGKPVSGNPFSSFPVMNVSWEEMMKKEFHGKISQPDHRYVIVSDSRAEGVRAWVLLNQAGVKNLFILREEGVNDELFKYQFQPDTTIRLELDSSDE